MTFPVPPVGEGVDFSGTVRHRVTSKDYRPIGKFGGENPHEPPRRRKPSRVRIFVRKLLRRG